MKHANVSVFVPHIGCPCRCSFCDQKAITGGAKAPTPQEVWETAERAARDLCDRVSSAQIAFFGGSFTAIDESYMLSLLEPAFKAVKEFRFSGIRCSTRPDAIDERILKLLKSYGVTAIELGAQSMDDEVLKLNRRGHSAAQTVRAAELIKAYGFELGLQMMTGLLGDTDEKAIATMESIIALQPRTVRIYPTVVLPNTYLAELYEKSEYSPQTLEEAVELCSILLLRFEQAEVRVIRLGLHAEEDVNERRLAGPYHPAFRELVQSRVFLRELEKALKPLGAGEYGVSVNPKAISVALGQKKENQKKLAEMGYKVSFLQENGIEKGKFEIRTQERKEGSA